MTKADFVIITYCSSRYLSLVEVIDDLLVQLVFELTLSGRLVTVSLRQVGGTGLFRPLTKQHHNYTPQIHRINPPVTR